MNLFPPTVNQKLLMLVVTGCLGLGYLFFRNLWIYSQGNMAAGPCSPLFFGILVAGLWRMTEWARKVLTLFTVIMVILVPINAMNPLNSAEFQNPRTTLEFMYQVFAPSLIALLYVYALGRYRDQFRRKYW